MAPQVEKTKTAFLFFQKDQLAVVKNEMGGSMGEAMQEVCRKQNNSCAWINCTVGTRFAVSWLFSGRLQHDLLIDH